MANCAHEDVRLIIDTGLIDTNIESLIALADQEITDRGLDGLTTIVKKQISMLLTASLASMNDVRSRGINSSEAVASNLPQYYREQAEALIARSGDIAFSVYTESEDE